MELGFNSDRQTIGNSLMATLAEIEIKGETPVLKAEMLFKFARMKFIEKEYIEAYKIFQQCNIHLMDNNLPEFKELYYWVARIFEEQGEKEKAKNAYTMVLKRARFLNDQVFVDEILDRIHQIEIERK